MKLGWTPSVKYASVRSKEVKKENCVIKVRVFTRVSILKCSAEIMELNEERSKISLKDPLDFHLRKILLTNSPGWCSHITIAFL